MFTDIGIDLGSYKTVIMAGQKLVLEEPTAAAIDTETGKPLFFGKAAFDLAGRTDQNITVIRPVKHGVVSDMELCCGMLKFFLRKAFGNRIVKPRVAITAPGNATAVEQRSVAQIVEEAGGRDVRVVETATAAAIGLGLNFTMPHGSMIVDLGAGTTDIAVTSMGGVAECVTIPTASADYDEAIVKFVRQEYNMLIGPHTAEKIKMQIGAAYSRSMPLTMQAGGIDLVTGMPKSFSVTSEQIYTATSPVTEAIGAAVAGVLERTLPDLAADICEDGIRLVGGGAALFGLGEYLRERTGVAAAPAEGHAQIVARGVGIAVRNPNLLRTSDYEYRTRKNLYSDES